MSITNNASGCDVGRVPDEIKQNQNDECFLFCTLAIALDILSASQVEEIVEAWTNDSGATIAKFAVSRGFITEQKCEVLVAAVSQLIPVGECGPQSSIDESLVADEDVQALLEEFIGKDINMADLFGLQKSGDSVASRFGLQETDRFDVLHSYAKGGLGEVFIAKDKELNREVAIKKIRNWHSDNSESCQRFILEAEITGRLEHPGIVPVYGMGMDDDKRPFYAMRMIHGNSLKEELQKFHAGETLGVKSIHSVRFRKLLSNFVDVCQAVSYAHSRGVLHRDLKPSNIILGKYGEALVVDWGLAKVLGTNDDSGTDEEAFVPSGSSSIEITVQGRIVGTPAYMSPEQTMGSSSTLDERTDVYSLGATFYSILTGQPPFESHRDTLEAVQIGRFDSPLLVNPNLPKPLVAICRKAMSTNKNERYQTPRDLAADIDLWLADEPVSAYEEQRIEKLGRTYRRNRRVFAVSIGFLCLLAFSALGAAYVLATKNYELQQSRQSVESERDKAVEKSESVQSLGSVVLWLQEDAFSKLPEHVSNRHILAERVNEVMCVYHLHDPSNPEAAVHYIRSLRSLALVELQLEKHDACHQHFETALALVKATRQMKPVPADVDQKEFQLLWDLATLASKRGQLKQSRSLLMRAQPFADRVARATPDSVMSRRNVASVNARLASCAYYAGEFAAADRHATLAAEELVSICESPNSHRYDVGALLDCYDILRAVALNRGDTEKALVYAETAYQKALANKNANPTNRARYQWHRNRIKRLEVIIKEDPNDPQIVAELAAVEHDARALIFEFPKYTKYSKNLARCLIYQARHGDRSLARQKTDEALSLLRISEIAEFRELTVEALMERATTHENKTEADEDLKSASETLKDLMLDLPSDPELQKKREALKNLMN